MVQLVAEQLALSLAQSAIVSKISGLIREHRTVDGNRPVTLPVGVLLKHGDNTEAYMVPDERESAVAYFEQVGRVTEVLKQGRATLYAAELRLVVWLNLRKIQPPNTGQIAAYFMSQLTDAALPDSHPVTNSRVVSIVPEAPDGAIWKRWTLDEAQTQFLMPPFDYCSFLIGVRFAVSASANCLTAATIVQPTC